MLDALYVSPSLRLHGIGRQLVDAAREWGESRGCARVVYWDLANVSHPSLAALGHLGIAGSSSA